ncbi:MAG: glycosyltransferase, partial [Anaerolineales bacterium]|nr:glycosyltransferase [Anaerolineales bacterium]
MTITILAAGSRGDVQPYVALGAALRRAGARGRLATFGSFAPRVEGAGLDHFPLAGDIMGVAASDDVRHALEADNPLKVLLSFNRLKTLAAGLNAGFCAACAGATAVVYHPGAAIGDSIARHLGVPGILAAP